MELEQLRVYCLSKKGTAEEMPFDNETLVFKVMGKMFMLLVLESWERGEPSINVKCDPQTAIELREKYDGVVTGAWHMNKIHWNSIHLHQGMKDIEALQWIDHSYDLVVSGLTKKFQIELKAF
jgi:predicted DNA-binding protein (MmcQ/YjbR family)